MLNETENMDELFKKAAEHYPLLLNPKDWEEIPPTVLPASTAVKSSYKRYLIALLLIVTAILSALLLNSNNEQSKLIAELKENKSRNRDEVNLIKKVDPNNAATSVEEIEKINASNNIAAEQTPVSEDNLNFSGEKMPPKAKTVSESKYSSEVFPKEKQTTEKNKFAFLKKEDPARVASGNGTNANEQTNQEKIKKGETNQTILRHDITEEKKELNIEQTQAKDFSIAENKQTDEEKTAVKIASKKSKKQFFYGLSFGLNFSTVKGQATSRPMSDFGIIAGLSLTKSLSIESGIQISSKKYFSNGSFFNPKSGVMPANMVVEKMVGQINSIDIPLLLKYAPAVAKNKFFVTTGFNNSIITSEHNVYETKTNGQPKQFIGNYNNTKLIPATALNISVGFQQKIGNKLRGQLEPYLQIPIRKTGIGYMPVTNFGVRIALLKMR